MPMIDPSSAMACTHSAGAVTVVRRGIWYSITGKSILIDALSLALGARGGVLASASIYPKIWLQIFALARDGKLGEALRLQQRSIDPVIDVIFREMNPGPLKKYMALAGMPVGSVRLPLLPPGAETEALLQAVLRQAQAANLA